MNVTGYAKKVLLLNENNQNSEWGSFADLFLARDVFLTRGAGCLRTFPAPFRRQKEKMLYNLFRKTTRVNSALVVGAFGVLLAGCQTPAIRPPTPTPAPAAAPGTVATDPGLSNSTNSALGREPSNLSSDALVLREGDSLHIQFAGAPSFDSTQSIRRDGKITLNMVGEIKAAGLTPQGLEKELLKDYASQLVIKQVTVTVQSSVFTIFITGAINRPGILTSERVLTPIEALIEAGIDPIKSNLKSVAVIRERPNGVNERYRLNLSKILHGKPFPPFVLQPGDIVYVPEKFSWY